MLLLLQLLLLLQKLLTVVGDLEGLLLGELDFLSLGESVADKANSAHCISLYSHGLGVLFVLAHRWWTVTMRGGRGLRVKLGHESFVSLLR